jgi:hypothetical protein
VIQLLGAGQGDGAPEGIHQRAAANMIETAKAAQRFGMNIVTGFTVSDRIRLLTEGYKE